VESHDVSAASPAGAEGPHCGSSSDPGPSGIARSGFGIPHRWRPPSQRVKTPYERCEAGYSSRCGEIMGVGSLKLALVGTYPPRRCGIATFTASLADALRAACPTSVVEVVACVDRHGQAC